MALTFTASQGWPLMTAKSAAHPEFFAYFSNGAIRHIGGTEKDLYQGNGVYHDGAMSEGSYTLAKTVSQALFGVPTV